MKAKYAVLEVLDHREGALRSVRWRKPQKSWTSLQLALDEMGKEGWRLITTIYGPGGEARPGEHSCEAFILQQGVAVEYTVLEADGEKGPLEFVRCGKTKRRWEGWVALQDALDELGQEGWILNLSIYGPTYGDSGTHRCEGFVLHRGSVVEETSA